MNKVYLFIVISLSCVSCAKTQENKLLSSWPNGITYEIFIQSFADGNGDGIGDFKGATSKLDYLSELGIEAIWLMPIMPSPSYHKYDVTNYRDIHPDYGTMEDFKEFLKEAHRQNIKIIIDLIINHTSDHHPWFKSAASSEDNKYRDYYVWANKDSIKDKLAKKELSFDSDNIRQWHPVNGDTTSDQYYGFFTGAMPDLNFDNEEVRKEVFDLGRFWLEEIGVDGFRLDAARHIYPDDQQEKNHAFWKEFKAEMVKINPEVYTVGEVWLNAEKTAPYTTGFSALFNFDLAFSILESVKQEKDISATISGHGWDIKEDEPLVKTLIQNLEVFRASNRDFISATFLSNHDQNRYLSFLDNNIPKAKLAASILFTLPGQPYIYYGEEIGMKGMKPDPLIREPFLWAPKRDDRMRTSWEKAKFSTDKTVEPLSNQILDEHSIYHHYKDLINLRRSSETLTFGDITETGYSSKEILSFTRNYKGKSLTVYHNLTESDYELIGMTGKKVFYSTDNAQIEMGILTLKPYSSAIVE